MRILPIFRLATMAVVCVASSACSSLTGYPVRPESSVTLAEKQNTYFGLDSDKHYRELTDADSRKVERNRIVFGRIRVIGDKFLELERNLNGAGNAVSLGGDLGILVVNGVAATTGSAATKSALSVLSGGIVGAQGAINKDLYYQRTLPALIAQMQANFEKQRLAITDKLSRPDTDYPLEAAEGDLQKLEDAGSLPSAVSQITQQAQTDKLTTDKLDQLRSLGTVSTPTTTRLTSWIFNTDGSVNTANFSALQTWLDAQPEAYLHDYPPAMFVSGDNADGTLEPLRGRAVKDLNIP